MLKSDSEEQVKCWLTRFLPGLGEEDLMNYRARLIADGFDCQKDDLCEGRTLALHDECAPKDADFKY